MCFPELCQRLLGIPHAQTLSLSRSFSAQIGISRPRTIIEIFAVNHCFPFSNHLQIDRFVLNKYLTYNPLPVGGNVSRISHHYSCSRRH